MAGVVCSVALALGACASGDGPPATVKASIATDVIDSVPFLSGSTLAPGTALRDGIVIVEGSRGLVGPIPEQLFLTAGGPDRDLGWSALAVVTGDVQAVLADYAAQASKLGLAVPASTCVRTGSTRPGAVPVTSCTAASESADDRLVYRVDYTQSAGLPGFMPVSHVWITVHRLTEPWPLGASGFVVGAPVSGLGRGSDPHWPTTLPKVGEPFEPGTQTGPAFRVPPGAALVGPPGVPEMSADIDTPVAVLRVDGDVADVVASFRTTFRAGYEHHSTSAQEGVRKESWYWTNGDTATVDVYREPDRPTLMVVWHAQGD